MPREEHKDLLSRFFHWLKPDGYLLATVTNQREEPYTETDFYDVTMYWSNWGLTDYQQMLEEIGFNLIETSQLEHGYVENFDGPGEVHPIIFARTAPVSGVDQG